ncbi:unnamed protein product [Gadus morhua 'NCC']
MATVAPFRYRLQVEQNDLSLDELSDCSSGSIDVCCDAFTLGHQPLQQGIVGNPREDAAARQCLQKIQSKPSRSWLLPQVLSRRLGPEADRVYRPRLGLHPHPQRHAGQAPQAALAHQPGRSSRTPRRRCTSTRHPCGAMTWAGPAPAPPPGAGQDRWSAGAAKGPPVPDALQGPYAEVKPISQGPEPSKGPDPSETPTSSSNGTGSTGINAKKPGEKGRAEAPSAEGKKEAKEVEGESPFLKVDPELVVTVLGDLEQLLFSQMLGESP